jgi:hypothetical protein
MLCAFSKALAALLLARTLGDNSWIVGNREVGPQVLSFGVDRIQWNFEPMRNHAENCFEL